MEAEDVIELYKLFKENGIEVWIDGGWGIDALLGKQTRPHNDLDIAIYHKDKPKLRKLLEERGYKDIERGDTSDWNFVVVSGNKEIDTHVFEFDNDGNNIYGIEYPKDSLTGTGIINGVTVRCISLDYVIKFHENYEPKEKDFTDIKALCDKFGLELPKNYKKSQLH
ncbi:nucleotidyltransferase family protein [Candidatus Microgenomates bacterium]|nr:nucleotidyltransferase family protein [Candidatus Microgenomates bacterium]